MHREQVVEISFDPAPEHTYDGGQAALAIQLDTQGSVMWYFPALLPAPAQVRLLDSLETALNSSQTRPHAFGLLPPESQSAPEYGHQQWYARSPNMRANSR